MANSDTLTSGVAERYASALFDLALGDKALASVEKDLVRFDDLMNGSDDLKRMVKSPVFSADEQLQAISAVLDASKIGGLVGNFVRLVAKNRRLFAMPDMLGAFRKLLAAHKGEVSADVTVAAKLSAAHKKDLQAALKEVVGKTVAINEIIDPSIIGGMIVKIGSRQIDTSLRTKLSSLRIALKEVD